MAKATIAPGQTLLDIAIQHAGDASAMLAIALENGMAVTDDLVPGQTINVPEVVNEKVTRYYQRNRIVPAVGILEKKEGIGYWVIEDDFIVQ